MAAKTLKLPEFSGRDVTVYNVGRDEARVTMADSDSLVVEEEPEETAVESRSGRPRAAAPAAPAAAAPAPVESAPAAPAAPAGAPSGAAVADIPFKASDAIATLLAYSAKVRPDQIGDNDTTDTLTNGVSSRRNQLLMDISSELGVASVDGAAEASISALSALVDKVAPNYKAFGPVLSDIVRDRVRGMFGAAGLKVAGIEKRVTDTWQLGAGWASNVVATLVLETREGASARGGDLAGIGSEPASNAGRRQRHDRRGRAEGRRQPRRLRGHAVRRRRGRRRRGRLGRAGRLRRPGHRLPMVCSPPPPASC